MFTILVIFKTPGVLSRIFVLPARFQGKKEATVCFLLIIKKQRQIHRLL